MQIQKLVAEHAEQVPFMFHEDASVFVKSILKRIFI